LAVFFAGTEGMGHLSYTLTWRVYVQAPYPARVAHGLTHKCPILRVFCHLELARARYSPMRTNAKVRAPG
jgi:hypothetical protein